MVEDTQGMPQELFAAYAAIAGKAALRDGVYGPREALALDAQTDALFALGFLAIDAEGNVVLPRMRALIPAVFID